MATAYLNVTFHNTISPTASYILSRTRLCFQRYCFYVTVTDPTPSQSSTQVNVSVTLQVTFRWQGLYLNYIKITDSTPSQSRKSCNLSGWKTFQQIPSKCLSHTATLLILHPVSQESHVTYQDERPVSKSQVNVSVTLQIMFRGRRLWKTIQLNAVRGQK